MAALLLKKPIERSSVIFATTDTTKTITLATELVSTSKTVLFFTVNSGSNEPINYHVLGRVLSTTQIQFERMATPAVACTVEYQVIEFSQGITVQHFYISQNSGTVNTTISEVDLSKAFPIITMAQTGATFGANDLIMAEITSTVNLATTIGSVSTCPAAVQVIQIDDAAVQKFNDTYGTGATKDITVTTINSAKTFWFFSVNSAGTTVNSSFPYLAYVGTTLLRFTRASSSGENFTLRIYVVSLSSGVTVQNISTVIASGNTSISPTITSVTVNNTALLLNGIYQRIGSVDDTTDDGGYSLMNLASLTETAFTATRVDTPALATTANVQVLSFVTTDATGSWFLLPWKNEVYNTMQNVNGMR